MSELVFLDPPAAQPANPFLTYRKELFAGYSTAQHLRDLVLNLWGGRPVNLGRLLNNADQRHTRIVMAFIEYFAENGEDCPVFMALADEIIDFSKPKRSTNTPQ